MDERTKLLLTFTTCGNCSTANQFIAKSSKCTFGQVTVEYLGHIVSGKGVQMDQDKITTTVNWSQPQTVMALHGFLGLMGYYRRFVRRYAMNASPLTDLLQKDAFVWTEKAQLAFAQLKEALTTAPILELPNFSLPFTVETDASGQGLVRC
ncbi:uncharacterized mitochondrial protein AtMg00860-like [Tripterygium wilfordii]|uniref:uncharacterized mitochondrial protein AtMg00860-like n=1 Tax=Tripterygium wilfordii TaxID=458696 RepID=UPI0018F7F9C9|nr:uncharacterized mitochondrial protein AtMg00860-like [Tripterygium wilfordii]